MFGNISFWNEANSLVEKAFYSGTGAFVMKLDGILAGEDGAVLTSPEARIRMEYLPAMCIFPITVHYHQITEVAFASESTVRGKNHVYVEIHTLENGLYVIQNKYFKSESGRLVPDALPDGVAERINTGSPYPFFSIIRPNTVNPYDNNLGLGCAVFSQAIANLKGVDIAYNNFNRDLWLGGKTMKDGIRTLSRKGLAAIQYPTGWVDYLDVVFRRATLTGVNQTAAELQIQRMDEMDTDLVETTAHHGARTAPGTGASNHSWWQGHWFSRSHKPSKYPDFYEQTGYGTGAGLCGWNCRHSFFPVIEGLSDRAYSINELRQLNDRKATYNGNEMSLYDATQQQRHIERQIRRWKREKDGFEAAGIDSSFATEKVKQWQATQRDFISQTGLRRDYFRERAGKQNLEINTESGIITLDKAGREVFARKDFEEVKNFRVSNLAVRQWYTHHTSQIPDKIDRSQPLETQARQSHRLRNQYRNQARNLMADQEERKKLDISDPNPSFEEFVADKMTRKSMSRKEVFEYILESAARTNKGVNRKLGMEE